MKRVLILSPYEDTGGIGIALKQAFDRWAPAWSARHVRRRNNYIEYPADIEWSGEFPSRLVSDLYRFADVVHVMERPDILDELGPTKAKIVVYHLGSYYRDDPDSVSARCKALGAVEVAGGLDLLLQPHLRFVPIPSFDVEALAAHRKRYRSSGRLRIAHAPTSRAGKSTEAIIRAVKRLRQSHKVDLDIIEGQPWEQCLRRKALADIYVDETTYGYGMNALECWAMGIPVVSGIADPETRTWMIAEFGGLPFFEATEKSLYQSLEMLITDPVLRAEWADRGRHHLQAVHAPNVVVQRMIELYGEA